MYIIYINYFILCVTLYIIGIIITKKSRITEIVLYQQYTSYFSFVYLVKSCLLSP